MTRINVDFSANGAELEPGMYDALLNDVKLRTGQNGSQFLNWEFTIFDEKAPNRKVWAITGLAENSMWTTIKNLKALGRIPPQDQVALDLEFDDETGYLVEPELVDVPCQIKISYREWQGKKQTQVDILKVLSSEGSIKF